MKTKFQLFNRLLHSAAARWTLALTVGLVIAVAASSASAFARDCGDIRESVLRLHILAHSDSEEDQSLKLAVRDCLLQMDQTLFWGAESLEDAEAVAAARLNQLRQAAQDEVARQGYDYPVQAELANMYFSTRQYEKLTLPAGWYDAVRITIGAGGGHNWWCVLYPPLCLPAAEGVAVDATGEEQLAALLTPEEMEIVRGGEKYEYSFAVVELYEKLKNLLSGE